MSSRSKLRLHANPDVLRPGARVEFPTVNSRPSQKATQPALSSGLDVDRLEPS